MSRYALHAVIAIRIAAQQGQWVLIRDLCTYLGVTHSAVLRACQDMESNKLLVTQRADGTGEVYAIRTPCDGLHPQDPPSPTLAATAPLPRDLSVMYSAVALQGEIL